jgi:hypothetical protein
LKSLKDTENIPWFCDTGAEATCLSENFFEISLRKTDPKKCSPTEDQSEQEDDH